MTQVFLFFCQYSNISFTLINCWVMRHRHSFQVADTQAILLCLFQSYKHGQLKRGAIHEASKIFKIGESTISGIWNCWLSNCQPLSLPIPKIPCARASNGRPIKYDREAMIEAIGALPVAARTTICDIAGHLGISPSTVHRVIHKEELLWVHYNKIKPVLSNENKVQRIEYCLDKRDITTGLTSYKPMENHIHLDEKWFFLTQELLKCYLLPDKKNPHRKTCHKSHITKLMFIVAVARPSDK